MKLAGILFMAAGCACIAQQPAIQRIGSGMTIVPGAWVSISGANLSSSTREWRASDFNGDTPPVALDGVSVRFNGVAAPISYVSPALLRVLVPTQPGSGPVPVTVTTAAGTSAPADATQQPYLPEWLAAAVFHADQTPVSPASPAKQGEQLVLYGNGFGSSAKDLDIRLDGAPFDDARATFEFAGLAGLGIYQINFTVPANLGDGFYWLRVSISGFAAQALPVTVRGPESVPVLFKMTPSDFVWGQQSRVSISGAGLGQITAVTVSDASQVNILHDEGDQQFQIAIDGNATPGQRTLTVTNGKGQSNAIPFTIRRGEPRIVALKPSTVWPGRLYTPEEFSIAGEDLAGVSNVNFLPAAGVRFPGSYLQLNDDVPAGTIAIRLQTPWDSSPPAMLQVVPPPASAPSIRALVLNEPGLWEDPMAPGFRWRSRYNGQFDFTDGDGDIQKFSGSRVRLLAETAEGFLALSCTGAFLDKEGQRSGSIQFSCNGAARSSIPGPITVWVTLFDAAGNPSNAAKGTVSAWYR